MDLNTSLVSKELLHHFFAPGFCAQFIYLYYWVQADIMSIGKSGEHVQSPFTTLEVVNNN